MTSSIILLLSAMCVVLSMTMHYFLGKGKMRQTYTVNICAALSAIALNLTLFLTHPENAGVLLFLLTASWNIFNSVRGLIRIRNKVVDGT